MPVKGVLGLKVISKLVEFMEMSGSNISLILSHDTVMPKKRNVITDVKMCFVFIRVNVYKFLVAYKHPEVGRIGR